MEQCCTGSFAKNKCMEIKDKIIIAKEFTDHVGARYRTDGEWSGEKFLEEMLLPKFEKAVADGYSVLVDLDGLYGNPSSFISGSFGKLSVDKGAALVLEHLQFKSDDNPLRIVKVTNEIKNPRKGSREM